MARRHHELTCETAENVNFLHAFFLKKNAANVGGEVLKRLRTHSFKECGAPLRPLPPEFQPLDQIHQLARQKERVVPAEADRIDGQSADNGKAQDDRKLVGHDAGGYAKAASCAQSTVI